VSPSKNVTSVAYQGEPGAYSQQALLAYFGATCEALHVKHLEDVFDAIQSERAERGIVPVENSSAGSIYETYDLLFERKLAIVGEHYLKVDHCLLTLPEAQRSQLKVVYSHPQALGQCYRYLNTLGLERRAFYDTAGAAAWVAEQKNPAYAAVASALAAEHYGLRVMAKSVQTYTHNTTRFLVLSKDEAASRGGAYKTSIVFETRDLPAALYKCLGGFATNGINLCKLESRPSQTGMGRYRFYLDCEGHESEPMVDQALRELQFFTASYRVLGSYTQGKLAA